VINSNKARLISILISSLVAISILLLNQWFTQKQERDKLLIAKISELISVYNRGDREFSFVFDPNDIKEVQG